MSKVKLWLLRTIATLQIAGGLFLLGVYLLVVIPHLVTHPQGNMLFSWGVVGLFMLLSLLSVYAGALLWQQKKSGFHLSALLQLLQIPYLQLSTFFYTLQVSLITFMVKGTGDDAINFTLGFGAKSYLYWGEGVSNETIIGFNLVAILFFILILWLKPRDSK